MVFPGAQVAYETDSSGAEGWRYVWGLGTDQLVVARDSAGTTYDAVTDNLGSLRGWYNPATDTQLGTQLFTPYGTRVHLDHTPFLTFPPYGWTGREYDAETGFSYLRARYYDPSEYRFVQEDPAGYDGGDNLYAYVGGAVLSATDPSGMLPSPDGAFKMDGYIWAGNPSVYAQDDIDPMMFSGPGSMLPTKVTYLTLDGKVLAAYDGWLVSNTTIIGAGSSEWANNVAFLMQNSSWFRNAMYTASRDMSTTGIPFQLREGALSSSGTNAEPFGVTVAIGAGGQRIENDGDLGGLVGIVAEVRSQDLRDRALVSYYDGQGYSPSLYGIMAHEMGHVLNYYGAYIGGRSVDVSPGLGHGAIGGPVLRSAPPRG